MSGKYFIVLSLFIFSRAVVAQSYITNVTVVNVEKQKLKSNQTVVITEVLISKNLLTVEAKVLFKKLVHVV